VSGILAFRIPLEAREELASNWGAEIVAHFDSLSTALACRLEPLVAQRECIAIWVSFMRFGKCSVPPSSRFRASAADNPEASNAREGSPATSNESLILMIAAVERTKRNAGMGLRIAPRSTRECRKGHN
jgi:hypothetical protein